MNWMSKAIGVTLIAAAVLWIPLACTHQPWVLPGSQRTGDPTLCFDRDVLPIFQSNCAKAGCHDAASGRSGYVLDSYDNIVKNGIVPGNLAASKIWESVTFAKGDNKMPKDAPALSGASLDVIRRWIQGGAIKDTGGCSAPCDTNSYTYSGTIAPLMQTHCVGCHNSASAPGGSLADYNSVKAAAESGKLRLHCSPSGLRCNAPRWCKAGRLPDHTGKKMDRSRNAKQLVNPVFPRQHIAP